MNAVSGNVGPAGSDRKPDIVFDEHDINRAASHPKGPPERRSSVHSVCVGFSSAFKAERSENSKLRCTGRGPLGVP